MENTNVYHISSIFFFLLNTKTIDELNNNALHVAYISTPTNTEFSAKIKASQNLF